MLEKETADHLDPHSFNFLLLDGEVHSVAQIGFRKLAVFLLQHLNYRRAQPVLAQVNFLVCQE